MITSRRQMSRLLDRLTFGGLRMAVSIVVTLILALFAVQLVLGIAQDSAALLGDAVHHLTDAIALTIAGVAVWLAERPHSDNRTFGYHRLEIFAAYINGMLLILAAVTLVIDSLRGITGDEHAIGEETLLAVFAIRLAVNLVSLLLLRPHRSNLAIQGITFHVIGDTLASVTFVIATAIGSAANYEHIEDFVAIGVALLLLWFGWRLLKSTALVLLEVSPKGTDVGSVRHDLEDIPGVEDVHDLHLWTVSSNFPALSSHLRIGQSADPDEVLHSASTLLRDRYGIEHATLQPEKALGHEGEQGWCCIQEHNPNEVGSA